MARTALAGEAREGCGREPCAIMIAFLKRRWVLLSCAGVLLAFTVIELRSVTEYEIHWDETSATTFFVRELGLRDGAFHNADKGLLLLFPGEHSDFRAAVRHPRFGGLPVWRSSQSEFEFSCPLWPPLAAVLGWIVIRELRWRERRAKVAQSEQ